MTNISGEVERVTFENDETGFRVLKVNVTGRGVLPVVGVFQAVGAGTRVSVTGEYVQDKKHGEQFRATALVPLLPDTLVGLERYLGSGLIPGVGPGFAKKIVSTFGLNTLKVLDDQPDLLRTVKGLGPARAEQIHLRWVQQRSISDVMMLLQAHGASPALAVRIFKQYGDRAASVVQSSPYRLAMEVRGIGFKTADMLARSLGISGDHPDRARAGVLHQLGQLADSGHVCVPRDELLESTMAMLEVDAGHVAAAVDALWGQERVVVVEGQVYLTKLHTAELEIRDSLFRLMTSPGKKLEAGSAIARFESSAGLVLAAEQRVAVEMAAEHKVLVLTGGPGVGKTTIVRAMLEVFLSAKLTVRMGAPTGRAAKRMAEATGTEASTLHRMLEYDPRARLFQRNEDKVLDAEVIIVDEASMLDVELAASLLRAIGSESRLILVGDVDQLPSVGPGAVLRDVISSGQVPTAKLERVFRQDAESGIIGNAYKILHGEIPEGAVDQPGADFFVIERTDPEAAASVIRELVCERIPKRFGFAARDDIQVLTPMHRGAAGTIALNEMLQQALNPRGIEIKRRGQVYRRGDKVMQTRNDYERDVFNGDVGVVHGVDSEQSQLSVRFGSRLVHYADSELDALNLAYATSIHKSQGSEYSAVVIPMLTSHFVMLSRNLLYTAVTRAKKLCVLVADPKALGIALGEVRREQRQTRLAELLRR